MATASPCRRPCEPYRPGVDPSTVDMITAALGSRSAALTVASNPGVAIALTDLGWRNRVANLKRRLDQERKTRDAARETLRAFQDEPDAAVRADLTASWSALLAACNERISEDERSLAEMEDHTYA